MKLNVSLSMPSVLSGTYTPDWALTVESNVKHLSEIRKLGPSIAAVRQAPGLEDHQLFKVTLEKEQFYYVTGIWEGVEAIQYGVSVEQIQTDGLHTIHTVSQTSVWRNPDYSGLRRFAPWVFWSFLLPINGNILSDSVQSRDGKYFWESRLVEAFERNLNVYVLGITDKHLVVELIPVSMLKEILTYYTNDPDWRGQYYRILISKEIVR